MSWTQFSAAFEWDGSLRDLYVLDTNLADWQATIDFLRTSTYNIAFELEGEPVPLPENIEPVFAKRNEIGVLLTMDVHGTIINCHFFTALEIEFDLDPREVDTEARLNDLFEFMRQFGRCLKKEVLLTAENAQDMVFFRFLPDSDEIEYIAH